MKKLISLFLIAVFLCFTALLCSSCGISTFEKVQSIKYQAGTSETTIKSRCKLEFTAERLQQPIENYESLEFFYQGSLSGEKKLYFEISSSNDVAVFYQTLTLNEAKKLKGETIVVKTLDNYYYYEIYALTITDVQMQYVKVRNTGNDEIEIKSYNNKDEVEKRRIKTDNYEIVLFQ